MPILKNILGFFVIGILLTNLSTQANASNCQIQSDSSSSKKSDSELLLKRIYEKRDSERKLTVNLSRKTLRICKDKLTFTVESPLAGYLYVLQLGSNGKVFNLLFPNRISSDNFIQANEIVTIPDKKSGFSITAAGPVGSDFLLIMVSDKQRSLEELKQTSLSEKIISLDASTPNMDLLTRSLVRVDSADSENKDAWAAELIEVKEVVE